MPVLSTTSNTLIKRLSSELHLSNRDVIQLLSKYRAIHACKCGTMTCNGHDLCHN